MICTFWVQLTRQAGWFEPYGVGGALLEVQAGNGIRQVSCVKRTNISVLASMETASRQLHAKFEAARALFDKAPLVGVEVSVASDLTAELSALEARFALLTGHLYIDASSGESGRLSANSEFARILAAEDFSGVVDRLVERGEGALRSAGVILREGFGDSAGRTARRRGLPASTGTASRGRGVRTGAATRPSAAVCADLQRLLDIYPRNGEGRNEGPGPAAGSAQFVDYERCPACGSDMAVDAGRSELHCYDAECGTIRELVGTVFDDSQFYSQEGQKAKSGTFNPNRHFQFWWAHILAREPEEEIGDKSDPDNLYGEGLLFALRAVVVRDRKVLRMLTVNDVRAMLREAGRTDLNKNVPLVLKKLTGVGPPQLSDAIAVRVENLFTKAIEIGERVRRPGRVNRNYYPYYIYKILDQLLAENDLENRRVLYYIYIQSKETVEADDADWEQICIDLAEISYVPTDRTKALKYSPL
jgi:hypothetical protein